MIFLKFTPHKNFSSQKNIESKKNNFRAKVKIFFKKRVKIIKKYNSSREKFAKTKIRLERKQKVDQKKRSKMEQK